MQTEKGEEDEMQLIMQVTVERARKYVSLTKNERATSRRVQVRNIRRRLCKIEERKYIRVLPTNMLFYNLCNITILKVMYFLPPHPCPLFFCSHISQSSPVLTRNISMPLKPLQGQLTQKKRDTVWDRYHSLCCASSPSHQS